MEWKKVKINLMECCCCILIMMSQAFVCVRASVCVFNTNLIPVMSECLTFESHPPPIYSWQAISSAVTATIPVITLPPNVVFTTCYQVSLLGIDKYISSNSPTLPPDCRVYFPRN